VSDGLAQKMMTRKVGQLCRSVASVVDEYGVGSGTAWTAVELSGATSGQPSYHPKRQLTDPNRVEDVCRPPRSMALSERKREPSAAQCESQATGPEYRLVVAIHLRSDVTLRDLIEREREVREVP